MSNFTSFMQFLVREMAIENLAFITEVVQIKQKFIKQVKNINVPNICDTPSDNNKCDGIDVKYKNEPKESQTNINNNNHSDSFDFGYILNLPSDIPQSSLLQIKNDLDKQWTLIYNKYIYSLAPLAINISYEMRQKCEKDIKNISLIKDSIEKLKIFDDILVEVHRLLSQSYFRYKIILNEDPKLMENVSVSSSQSVSISNV